MFSNSKFNNSDSAIESEMEKNSEKFELTKQEIENQENSKTTKTVVNRPKLNIPSVEKSKNSNGRPNVFRSKPSENKNISYNKNSDKESMSEIKSIEEVSQEDFIKEEEVVVKRVSRPVVNRQSSRRNVSSKYPQGSGFNNEFLIEDKKMAENGLPLRLDKLIDVVSDYQGLDAKAIKEIKKQALANPTSLMQEYNQIFMNEIKPNMENRHKSLEEAKRMNPDKIVFMFVKDGKQTFSALSKEKAVGYEAYDGVVIETMSSSRTPFPPANVLFENNNPKVIADNDSAFEEEKKNENVEKTVNKESELATNNGNVDFDNEVDLNSPPPSNSFRP